MATKKTATRKTKPATPAKAAGQESTKPAKAARTASRQAAAPGVAEKKKTSATKSRKPSVPAGAGPQELGVDNSSASILARAEEDMTRLLDSLNSQMSAAMHAFEELAAIHRGRGAVVTRTRPIDRATAMFQRLVTEIIDDRFAEVLPMLVALRVEMGQRSQAAGEQDASSQEFFTRGGEMLDQVLTTAEVQAYEPKVGDAYDPLIHLAVGETDRADLAGDVVSEVFQSGFRTVRGKVIQAARVKVNRR